MNRHVLDVVGEVCPVPLWRTREALDRLPPGSELVVETDYARSARNITEWCWRQGVRCRVESAGGIWRVVVTK